MGKCKNSRKKEEKGFFYGNSKNISAKNNFTPINSTPVSSKRSPIQLNNTLKTNIVATQTFDDDQAPLFSWINITKINDEIEHPQVAKNNLFIMEYNQSLVK